MFDLFKDHDIRTHVCLSTFRYFRMISPPSDSNRDNDGSCEWEKHRMGHVRIRDEVWLSGKHVLSSSLSPSSLYLVGIKRAFLI